MFDELNLAHLNNLLALAINFMQKIVSFIVAIFLLTSCATHKLSRADLVYEQARALPIGQRGIFYTDSFQRGALTKEEYDLAMKGVERQKAQSVAEQKFLASMTSGERAIYLQNQQIIAQQNLQYDAQQSAAQQAALGNAMAIATSATQANAVMVNNNANSMAILNAVNKRPFQLFTVPRSQPYVAPSTSIYRAPVIWRSSY